MGIAPSLCVCVTTCLVLECFSEIQSVVEGRVVIGIDLQDPLQLNERLAATFGHGGQEPREFDADRDFFFTSEAREFELEQARQ